jgi:Zn-dependent protease
MRFSEDFVQMLYRVPVLLISFMVHELSHAVVALGCGDSTARDAGRITLNPLKHIDPLGALMLIVARFGWAKPVPINPGNFRSPKRGIILTSLAGPLSNVLLAFIFAAAYGWAYIASRYGTLPDRFDLLWIATELFWEFLIINVSLAAFNLIPIPPLDGSKVLFALLPDRIYYNYVLRYERYGVLLIMALSFTGLLGRLLNPMVEALYRLIFQVLRPLL